jgi:Zn-dependent protease
VFNLSVPQLVQTVCAILTGLTVHELAHSYAALLLGDDTPKRLGRLTLNPIKHIDPIGFILLLIAGFGWAKPVSIDRQNLKRPRVDDTLIALAGPLSNFLLAVLLVLILKVVILVVPFSSVGVFESVVSVFISFLAINIALAVFNLLPIPPLDGSHLISNLLSLRNHSISASYFRYGSIALMVVIILDRITEVDLLPVGRVVRFFVFGLLRSFSVF